MARKYTDEELIEACKNSWSLSAVALKLNVVPTSPTRKILKKYITLLNIDVSHFNPLGYNRQPLTATDYLENQRYISTHKLKNKILKEKLMEFKCNCCQRTTWNDKPIALELHHKDGNSTNNVIENVELLCPNCHAQTSTYRGKNNKSKKIVEEIIKPKYIKPEPQIWECADCGKKISAYHTRCKSCARKLQPHKFDTSKEELYDLIWNQKLPFTTIGKIFNVSDNSIRDRCKELGIELRKGYFRNPAITKGDYLKTLLESDNYQLFG